MPSLPNAWELSIVALLLFLMTYEYPPFPLERTWVEPSLKFATTFNPLTLSNISLCLYVFDFESVAVKPISSTGVWYSVCDAPAIFL